MSLRAEPGQNPVLSVATDAALQAVDTNFLLNGDYLWSDESGGYIFLRNSTAALSSTVLPTSNSDAGALPGRLIFNGFGPSGPVPAAGAIITVADLAALALVDDSAMTDGQPVFVQSLRSFFYLFHQAPVVNDVTKENAFSGTAVWWRDEAPNRSWMGVTDFYIDSAAGDDENDGLTALTPVATLDEISRRSCEPSEIDSQQTFGFTIHVGAGGAAGNIASSNYGFAIVGSPVAGPQVLITAETNQNTALNTRQLTTATLAWARDTFYTITEVADSRGFVVGNPTGLSAETAFFDGGGTFFNPTAAVQHVQALTIPVVTFGLLGKRAPGAIFMRDVEVQGIETDMRITFFRCIVVGGTFDNNSTIFDTCIITSGVFGGDMLDISRSCIEDEIRPGQTKYQAILSLSADNYIVQGGFINVAYEAPSEGGGGTPACYVGYAGNLAILDTTHVIFQVGNGSTVMSKNSATARVWGTNNTGPVFRVDTDCRVFYRSAPATEFTVTTVGNNWETRASTGAWGALPVDDATFYCSITLR